MPEAPGVSGDVSGPAGRDGLTPGKSKRAIPGADAFGFGRKKGKDGEEGLLGFLQLHYSTGIPAPESVTRSSGNPNAQHFIQTFAKRPSPGWRQGEIAMPLI
jgi:hypothetical protein